jgi:DTW domain-containing protein YfiP
MPQTRVMYSLLPVRSCCDSCLQKQLCVTRADSRLRVCTMIVDEETCKMEGTSRMTDLIMHASNY